MLTIEDFLHQQRHLPQQDPRRRPVPNYPSGLLPDWMIRECVGIDPWAEGEKRPGKISYGLSSYGYDARLGEKFKLFSNVRHPLCPVDPKNIGDRSFEDIAPQEDGTGRWVIIPPNSYILGETVETFSIPRDVLAVCVGKSTLARCGLIVNTTPLEPSWTGKVTLEVSNASPCAAKLYAGEGVCQVLFYRTLAPCAVCYADKQGKYQDQKGLALPAVDR